MQHVSADIAGPVGLTADFELVVRARARDGDECRLIIRANNRKLYRIARSIVRDDYEAEDVVQEAYVSAFTHLDGFRSQSSLATWLSRIVINEALGRLRRRCRTPITEVDDIARS